MADNTIKIGGELESMATGKIVAAASAIKDKSRNKTQEVINGDVEAAIAEQSARFEALSQETSEAVASASESARAAEQYLADLQEAITELPDGQAVSAEVADHELRVSDLEANSATKEEVTSKYGDYTNKNDFIHVIADSEGNILEARKVDGKKHIYTDVEIVGESIRDVIRDYVDNFKGKSAVNTKIASSLKVDDIPDLILVVTDEDDNMLLSLSKKGVFDWFKGIPKHVASFVQDCITRSINEIKEENSQALFYSSNKAGKYLGIRHAPLSNISNMEDSFQMSIDNGAVACSFVVYSERRYTIADGRVTYDSEYSKQICKVIKQANENNIPVYVIIYGFPQWNETVHGTMSMASWNYALDWVVSLNGELLHELPDGTFYACKADGVRVCDELASNYISLNATPTECLEILDYSAVYVKDRLPNIKVVSSSLDRYVEDYYTEILSATLQNGHRFCDTFDILYLDVYGVPETMLAETTTMYVELVRQQPEIGTKKVIYTNGYHRAATNEDEQGSRYLRACLITVAEGADVYVPFTYEQYDGEVSVDPDGYHIMGYDFEDSVHMTICSLSNGASSGKDITYPGDMYSNIPLRIASFYNKNYIEFGKDFVQRFANGIAVTTDTPIHILKVEAMNNSRDVLLTVFDGDTTNDVIITSSSISTASGLGATILRITFDTDGVPTSSICEWQPRLALRKLWYLQSILQENMTRPKVRHYGNLYIASWSNDDGRNIYALWKVGMTSKNIQIQGAWYATDSLGDYLTVTDINVQVSSDPIYIYNATNLLIS